jgi:hypothetical protein
MWIEARQFLSLLGDDRVTVIAFGAIILFAVHLFTSSQTPAERAWSIAILAIATLWMLCAIAGLLGKTMASWSPLAVLLLALGNEASRNRAPGAERASARRALGAQTDAPQPSSEGETTDGSHSARAFDAALTDH